MNKHAENVKSAYNGRKVLVSGNTGFKGSWLCAWLRELGADVVGYSNGVPTEPSVFESAGQSDWLRYCEEDVRDAAAFKRVVHETKPDFIFHLAAQPLVRLSYDDPLLTIQTNAQGTANLLEALRDADWPVRVVCITSDKVYDNVEWVWGYREHDALGGKDPYSASKAMAELAIKTYVQSYFNSEDSPVRVAVGRAGNVIGGGDWAADRIVPDAMRAWSRGETVVLRNPASTRPWQHVLEPLGGYLVLGAGLAQDPQGLNGEAFNFGPRSEQNASVGELIETMQSHWPETGSRVEAQSGGGQKEAGLLKLNCDKALHLLQWAPALDFAETCRLTVEWYRAFYAKSRPVEELLAEDIRFYTSRWS